MEETIKNPRRLIFMLLALFCAICLSSVYKKSQTLDEAGHLEMGRQILSGQASRAIFQRMPITALNDLPLLILEKAGYTFSEKTTLYISRLATVLFSVVLAVLIFVWSKKLYGMEAGFFSLLLYIFSPNIIAHSRLATNDIYTALMMFAATFCFIVYCRRPTLKNLFVCAVLTGLAQITKQTALLLFPIFVLLYILSIFSTRSPLERSNTVSQRPGWKLLATHSLLFMFIVIMVINIVYGFNGTFGMLGIPLPKAYVEGIMVGIYFNSVADGHGLIYLLGKTSPNGFWYYYIICMALKMPLGILSLIAISLLLLKAYWRRHPLEEWALIAVPLTVFIFFSFFCTAQIGIRYLLPMFPFLFVAAGKVTAYRPKRRTTPYRAAIAVLLLWVMISSLSFYPHYISYVNEIIWHRIDTYKYLADSNVDWGQNEYYLQEYLKRNKGKARICVKPTKRVSDCRVIVDVNHLVGLCTVCGDIYAWLRKKYEPVDQIAYSWLVFDVPAAGKH